MINDITRGQPALLREAVTWSLDLSIVYPKPWWQRGIPALNGVGGRAYPDISMDASDGTSQASPTFAGILALATQLHRGGLGTVNPALAALGPRGATAGIIDVPAGYANTAYGVTGFSTATGYDIASGWGTIYAPAFVPALVTQIDRQHGPFQPSRQARDLLNRLQASIRTSADQVASGQIVTITGNGFIPGGSPNGTTILDGFGVFPPLPGQYGVTSGPYADPTSTVPGQTWDSVTVTVTGTGKNAPVQPPVVSGPGHRRRRHDRHGRGHVHRDDHGRRADPEHHVPGQERVIRQPVSGPGCLRQRIWRWSGQPPGAPAPAGLTAPPAT
jgi:hypothetical protein